jgi:hypothetical protein
MVNYHRDWAFAPSCCNCCHCHCRQTSWWALERGPILVVRLVNVNVNVLSSQRNNEIIIIIVVHIHNNMYQRFECGRGTSQGQRMGVGIADFIFIQFQWIFDITRQSKTRHVKHGVADLWQNQRILIVWISLKVNIMSMKEIEFGDLRRDFSMSVLPIKYPTDFPLSCQ